MSPNQFRAALGRLELSQKEAARLLGADERTTRRWALGERTIPEAVAILLNLALAGIISVEDIRKAKR